jgi:hypothetical protein
LVPAQGRSVLVGKAELEQVPASFLSVLADMSLAYWFNQILVVYCKWMGSPLAKDWDNII